jgi:hypothetical protein
MRKFLTATTAALALAGVTIGAAAPAEARYHGGYYGGYYGHRHHGNAGAVIGAGILGLAAGAAIASDRGGYYDRGYYGGYAYAPAYYAPPPPPPGYYYGGPVCRSDWRWDGWAHRYVRVSYCD